MTEIKLKLEKLKKFDRNLTEIKQLFMKKINFVYGLVIGIVIVAGLVMVSYLIYTHLIYPRIFSFEERCKKAEGVVFPAILGEGIDKSYSIIDNKQNPGEVCIPSRI